MLSDLKSKEDLDEIEQFLLDYNTNKIELNSFNMEIISSTHDFKEILQNRPQVGVFFNDSFDKMYLSFSSNESFLVDMGSIDYMELNSFFSNEKITKFIINPYKFLLWSDEYKFETKEFYDIAIYLKLLTNQVNPSLSLEEYIEKYSDITLTNIPVGKWNYIFSIFTFLFGNYLYQYILKFNLNLIAHIINQNALYEVCKIFRLTDNDDLTSIKIKPTNFAENIELSKNTLKEHYQDKLYAVTPLNRIIPHYSKDFEDSIESALVEDFTYTILNELYNDNIPVKYDIENGIFTINCKQNKLTNIVNIIQGTFYDVYETLFKTVPILNIDIQVIF